MKQCTNCGETKLLSEYHRDKNTKDGHIQKCKKCVQIKSKRWSSYYSQRYLNNKEEHNQKTKLWHKNHPEITRNKSNKRRAAKLQNGEYKIRKKFIKKLYNSPCSNCKSNLNIQMDHIIPLSRVGTHSEGNLQPLCRSCNASKGNKTMTEWKYRLTQVLPA